MEAAPATNTTLFYSLDGGVRCGVPCRCADGELTGAMVARLIADDLASSVHAFTFLVSPQGDSGGGDQVPVGEMDILSPASEIIVRERHRLDGCETATIGESSSMLLDAFRLAVECASHDPETCGGSGGAAETADGEDGDALMGRIPMDDGPSVSIMPPDGGATADLGTGTIVWARLSGFPWWPARLRRQRKRDVTGQLRPVRFLGGGTASLARVPQHMIVAFSARPDLCDVRLRKKSLQTRYRQAVIEARRATADAGSQITEQSDGSGSDSMSDDDDDDESDGEEDAPSHDNEQPEEEGEGAVVEDEDDDGREEEDDEDVEDVIHGPPVGSVVWAKVPCFPFWPATVTAPVAGDPRPPTSGAPYTFVTFFATNDVAWVDAEVGVVLFAERPDLMMAKLSKKSLRSKYRTAVEEACRRTAAGVASYDSGREGPLPPDVRSAEQGIAQPLLIEGKAPEPSGDGRAALQMSDK